MPGVPAKGPLFFEVDSATFSPMAREYRLIHPDIAPPRGRTRELVEELVRSWREGKNEGGNEIAAAVALLGSSSELCHLFQLTEEGALFRFLREWGTFIQVSEKSSCPLLERFRKERGWERVPLHVLGFSSATGALYVALTAAGVAGGEVVTASFNYVGVPNAIVAAGATPRFVDIDPGTWCMDPRSCSRAIGKSTRAILLTHVNAAADLEPYDDLFRRRGLDFPLIQDASLSAGSTCRGMRPGLINLGRGGMTVMSLSISKIFSGLGGGVLLGNDPSLMAQAYEIAHQGLDPADPSRIATFGLNFKMSALSAAIALEQFKRRGEILARRRRIRALYEEHLAHLISSGRVALQELDEEAVVTHFGVVLPMEQMPLARRLWERHRIEIGVWHAHHEQEIYRHLLRHRLPRLERTEALSKRLAFLPFHTMMRDEDVAFICRALAKELGGISKSGRVAGRRGRGTGRKKR